VDVFDLVLRYALDHNASDLHMVDGHVPVLRVDGELQLTETDNPALKDTELILQEIMSVTQFKEFRDKRHLGFSYGLPGVGRFRLEAFFNLGKMGLAVRLRAQSLPEVPDLGLPRVVGQLCRKPHGLILVTGPTGVGKTTTLTAMVDLINRERSCKIITIEDPVEHVHASKKSLVIQQEVHDDTPSFAIALRHVLRQDPDVVVVGEMRDLETIQTALTAAETGHLVLTTLHTSTASQTVDRIIDVFPGDQQHQVRVQMASCLAGIISQRLLPKITGEGRVLAYEILINTSGSRNLIREGKTQQLESVMQSSGGIGMCTMQNTIQKLYKDHLISKEVASIHLEELKDE
jgi:twitching motility protein PilT